MRVNYLFNIFYVPNNSIVLISIRVINHFTPFLLSSLRKHISIDKFEKSFIIYKNNCFNI